MNNKVRTVVGFRKGDALLREVLLEETISNLEVGQTFAFSGHPSLDRAIHGEISRISHVCFLEKEKLPVTYIDVAVD